MDQNQNEEQQNINKTTSNGYYYKQKNKIPWYQSCLIPFISGILGAVLILALYIGGTKIVDVFNNYNDEANITKAPANEKGGNIKDNKTSNKSVSKMIEDVSPSIVGVINKQKASGLESFFGGNNSEDSDGSGDSEETGTGTGVIYQSNGNTTYIVTNNHVIEDANEIEVRLHNDKSVKAKLVGTDVMTDLAVLKIEGNYNIEPIKFADSSKVKAGETVFALGNPLGLEFANSVTQGIISSEERTMNVQTSQGVTEATVIQTDAAINPGNSGGALIDLNGNLIGINSMKISRSDVEGIGFAIPSNEVNNIIKDIMDDGKVTRPYIGISMISIDDIPNQYKKELNLTTDKGVYISEVDEKADNGLKKDDVITKVDDKDVSDVSDIKNYIYNEKKPGDKITIKYIRDGKTHTTKITLKEQN
ncbi:trypsin-like peptidase domain-containing protein [Mammaliicoccus sciuri]|uniref:S1C family serine protease n=1 Tax=Mammaliicoccus sciuri TaxID=1296 RepID=UPI0021D2DCE9|nr:trypsin-like peptidase domain-containing protein [Mammaliicoccus sciuri]UXU84922.1 trypsin-like peptidase domain-containing protein [Mammaliicoccus sciuri]UXU94769.1 trypsin-like peptidase domain-containing protein [Mammaliicoccus sciuri]UXV16717.1 trypsin-like peptidase domain-containing protein [Mammaliicoccus sciuri]UXV24978.1 trypsin-like peptidase domain-containing protein [Mammaliicoccus sciuri]UXV27763.1 trypsin-like peptidase domain-containing protein [Mammaliicoccus sciuri]